MELNRSKNHVLPFLISVIYLLSLKENNIEKHFTKHKSNIIHSQKKQRTNSFKY